jgi:hypothetical protein
MYPQVTCLVLGLCVVGCGSSTDASAFDSALTAMVDDHTFASAESPRSARAGLDSITGIFQFIATTDSAYGPRSEQILLTLWDFHGPGSYPLDGDQQSGGTAAYIVWDSTGTTAQTFETLGLVPRGEVAVISDDPTNGWIEGTFAFTAVDYGATGDSIRVSAGHFRGFVPRH